MPVPRAEGYDRGLGVSPKDGGVVPEAAATGQAQGGFPLWKGDRRRREHRRTPLPVRFRGRWARAVESPLPFGEESCGIDP